MKLTDILLAMALIGLGSCSSTSVIDEPAAPAEEDMTISIGFSAPEAYGFPMTRVDNNLQLRYVAKLYKDTENVNKTIAEDRFVERKEILASEGNRVIFKAEPGDYVVAVFADYIDANATADAHGCYPDKYYNTSSNDDRVVMLAVKKETGVNKDVYSNVNTDNFDCFATIHPVHKVAQVYEKDIVLKRAVSKVRVVSKDGNIDGVDNIELTKFSFLYVYSFNQKCSLSAHTEITSGELTSRVGKIDVSDRNAKELFYFYTFGGDGSLGCSDIAFKINPKENYAYPDVSIRSGLIKPQPNYIYTVSGSMLTPSLEPNDEIRLNISQDENWNEGKTFTY
jgi:hypothetical protein